MQNIEKKGEYLYINGHCIKFDSADLAEEFLVNLIKEGYLD